MFDWEAVLVTLSISFESCLTYDSFFFTLSFLSFVIMLILEPMEKNFA